MFSVVSFLRLWSQIIGLSETQDTYMRGLETRTDAKEAAIRYDNDSLNVMIPWNWRRGAYIGYLRL